jgi:hypothetical protein
MTYFDLTPILPNTYMTYDIFYMTYDIQYDYYAARRVSHLSSLAGFSYSPILLYPCSPSVPSVPSVHLYYLTPI